jgi:hypothetical protein
VELAAGQTDGDGRVSLAIDDLESQGFNGYLEVSADGYVPVLRAVAPNIVADGNGVQVSMFTTGLVAGFASSLNVTPEPDRGILVADAQDCGRHLAPGVVFEASSADAASTPFYFDGNLPSTTAMETSLPNCSGGFANVKAGPVKLTARVAIDARVSSEISTFVQPGTITIVPALPTPSP